MRSTMLFGLGFLNCTVSLGCPLEIRFPFRMCGHVLVCVPRLSSSDVVLLFLVLGFYWYSCVNILDICEQILSIRGFVICVQLFNDAIISLLLSHFTPPFVGFC